MSDRLWRQGSFSSQAPVSRLIQSTGNLYWGCNGAILDDAASYIFRASKSNQPVRKT